MVNVEEIKLVVKDLETDLTRWDQNAWVTNGEEWGYPVSLELPGEINVVNPNVCGTRFCIAGMTVHRAGLFVGADRGDVENVYAKDGTRVGHVEDVAREILGLNESQASLIFDSNAGFIEDYDSGVDGYSFDEMKRLITEITGVTFDD